MDELKNLMQIIHTNNMEFHGIIKKSKNRIELKDIKVVSVFFIKCDYKNVFSPIVYENWLFHPHSMARAILKKSIHFSTSTNTVSKYIPKRPRICSN